MVEYDSAQILLLTSSSKSDLVRQARQASKVDNISQGQHQSQSQHQSQRLMGFNLTVTVMTVMMTFNLKTITSFND